MNKTFNTFFSVVGLSAQIYFLINALNIWFHHITINFKTIIESVFGILFVIMGILFTIISSIFYKNNYKVTNIINYISMAMLFVSFIFLIL